MAETKFEGKTTANIELDGTKQQLELLITTRIAHVRLDDKAGNLPWNG